MPATFKNMHSPATYFIVNKIILDYNYETENLDLAN